MQALLAPRFHLENVAKIQRNGGRARHSGTAGKRPRFGKALVPAKLPEQLLDTSRELRWTRAADRSVIQDGLG